MDCCKTRELAVGLLSVLLSQSVNAQANRLAGAVTASVEWRLPAKQDHFSIKVHDVSSGGGLRSSRDGYRIVDVIVPELSDDFLVLDQTGSWIIDPSRNHSEDSNFGYLYAGSLGKAVRISTETGQRANFWAGSSEACVESALKINLPFLAFTAPIMDLSHDRAWAQGVVNRLLSAEDENIWQDEYVDPISGSKMKRYRITREIVFDGIPEKVGYELIVSNEGVDEGRVRECSFVYLKPMVERFTSRADIRHIEKQTKTTWKEVDYDGKKQILPVSIRQKLICEGKDMGDKTRIIDIEWKDTAEIEKLLADPKAILARSEIYRKKIDSLLNR